MTHDSNNFTDFSNSYWPQCMHFL